MGFVGFFKDRMVYILWSVAGTFVPYALDTDFLGYLGVDFLPGVESLDREKLGLKHYFIILAPVLLDREVFKIFGVDLFEGVYTGSTGPELDPLYDKNSGDIRSRNSSKENEGSNFVAGVFSAIFGFIFSAKGLIIVVVPFILVGGLVLGGYGDYLGVAANQYGAGIQSNQFVEDTKAALSEGTQQALCIAQGPECLRQWRLNNTKRPNSEDVGEDYGLEIQDFRLGSGSQLDIAYKDKDYKIPLSFRIRNNRHGLKGINARDVQYKVQVIDFENDEQHPYCETDWVPVQGYDVDDDGDSHDLYPGTSAATGYRTLNSLSLENCQMLSPGAGQHKTVKLYLKYNYFSQATLYFRAMSRQYKNAQNIDISAKPSETADTPVKAALNVDSPAVFSQQDMSSQPLAVRATLETDEPGIEYQVNDYRLRKSSKTCLPGEGDCGSGIDITQKCSFKDTGNGENMLELNSDSASRLIAGEGDGADAIPDDYWFSEDNPPSIFGCLFGLKEVETLNPSGETLTMGVEANYTVKIEETIDSFEVLNSQCRRLNCPIIFPVEQNIEGVVLAEKGDSLYWKKKSAMCEGIDARDGCKVVEGYKPSYTDLSSNPTIQSGEIAVKVRNTNRDWFSCDVRKGHKNPEYGVIEGFDLNRLQRVVEPSRSMVLDWENGEWRITIGGLCS